MDRQCSLNGWQQTSKASFSKRSKNWKAMPIQLEELLSANLYRHRWMWVSRSGDFQKGFYGDVKTGSGQRKRYRYSSKSSLLQFYTGTDDREFLAQDRVKWEICNQRRSSHIRERASHATEKYKTRRKRTTPTTRLRIVDVRNWCFRAVDCRVMTNSTLKMKIIFFATIQMTFTSRRTQ